MIRNLIKSNFRNDFSYMITFFLIMLLSTMMLYLGLAVLTGYEDMITQKKSDMNSADVAVERVLMMPDEKDIGDVLDETGIVKDYVILNPVTKRIRVDREDSNKDSKSVYNSSAGEFRFLPYEEWGEVETPHFIELSDEKYDDPIYISLYANTNTFKSKLGDKVHLVIDDEDYYFHLAGIYEGIISNTTTQTVYVNEDLFDDLKNEEGVPDQELIYIKLNDGVDNLSGAGIISDTFDDNKIVSTINEQEVATTTMTFMEKFFTAILAAFALIITIISMIIIYFRVNNSIEQNITNIGALKALGYTSTQIRISMIMEFVLTSAASVICGVGLAYLLMPKLEQSMEIFSGLKWDYGFYIIPFVITAGVMVGATVLVTIFSTVKIAKIDPVIALRFGVEAESGKKNHMPIEKTSGPLTWILALKSIMSSTKQNILLFVLMIGVGFTIGFSVFMAYNTVFNVTVVYKMMNVLSPDVEFFMTEPILDEIKGYSYVESAWWIDTIDVNAGGHQVKALITDEWSDDQELNIYDGHYPENENEISVNASVAEMIDVKIGDKIKVTYGGNDAEYTVVGMQQGITYSTKDIAMTKAGIERLGAEPNEYHVEVNVKDHSEENTGKLVDAVREKHDDELIRYADAIKALNSGKVPIVKANAAMVIVLIIVSLAVVVLTMSLLIKTVVIKRYREIGIKKAIGFSSNQLRIEFLLSTFPQVLIGGVVGALFAFFSSNTIFQKSMTTLKLMKCAMEVYPWMILINILFIAISSLLIIWMLTHRIKKVSAYSLITE